MAGGKPAQAKVGLLIILTIIALLVGFLAYLWAPAPPPPAPSATKLAVEAPLEAKVGSTVALTVKAVDEEGRLDETRNDVVELSLAPEGLGELSETKVRLEAGRATVALTAKAPGEVSVKAKWVQGYSFLKPGSANIKFR